MDSYTRAGATPVVRGSLDAATAACVTALAATLPSVLPFLALHVRSEGDPAMCGDLGSLTIGIVAFLLAELVFVVVVGHAARTLHRLRVLLVAPLGVAAPFADASLPLDVPRVEIGLCGEPVSLLVIVAAPALIGGLTYLLGRPRPANPPA